MVLVRAVAEWLLVLLVRLSLLLVLLLLLRMEVVHGGRVGVCLMRLMRLRLDLGVGILRHRLHLGVLGRCRKEVRSCLILLVAHIRHRVPGSILLLLVRVLLMLLMLMLMLMLLMELLLLLKLLLLLLLVLRISRLRGHLLIAMAIIGLPMARRLLAPVVHGGICHSRARCR